MPLVDEFISAVSLAEEHVKKVFDVSAIYVFRTYGREVIAHGMYLMLIKDGNLQVPFSVSLYLLSDGRILYISSTSRKKLEKYVNLRTDRPVLVLMLDFYKPPCVFSLVPVCKFKDILTKLSEGFNTFDNELINIIENVEFYVDISEYSGDFVYLMYSSSSLEPQRIALNVVAVSVAKLLVDGYLSVEDLGRKLRKLSEATAIT